MSFTFTVSAPHWKGRHSYVNLLQKYKMDVVAKAQELG